MTVNFSVRGSKENKKGLSPIEVSISYGGERVYFSTGKFTKPSAWSKPRQMVRGSTTEASLTNAYLMELRNKIHAKEIELMRRGYMVTASLLKDAVLDKVEELKAKTLLQVITEHNDEKRKLVGRRISPATLYGLDHSGKLVKEFIRRKYRRADIALREVNLGFMQSFHAFLMADRGMSQNDDRMEVYSPGGMFDGRLIQQLNPLTVPSKRRNPLLADFFHRLKLMERRGSGMKKIIGEYKRFEDLENYHAPEFRSNATEFHVTLWNLNYGADVVKDNLHVIKEANDVVKDVAKDTDDEYEGFFKRI